MPDRTKNTTVEAKMTHLPDVLLLAVQLLVFPDSSIY